MFIVYLLIDSQQYPVLISPILTGIQVVPIGPLFTRILDYVLAFVAFVFFLFSLKYPDFPLGCIRVHKFIVNARVTITVPPSPG